MASKHVQGAFGQMHIRRPKGYRKWKKTRRKMAQASRKRNRK